MKTIAAVLALLSAAAPILAQDAATETQSVDVSYRMAVGADGKPTSLTPLRELPPAIDTWIQARMRGYAFRPATVNGQPQPATTTLHLTLSPVHTADGKAGYAISNIATGPRLVRGRFDYYPRTVGAGYFRLEFDAQGKVTQAHVADMPFVGDAAFRKWALALVRSFRFEPETVAGKGVADKGLVPIRYCLNGKCPDLPPPPPSEGSALEEGLVARSVLALPEAGG